jgi:hypothetical protein
MKLMRTSLSDCCPTIAVSKAGVCVADPCRLFSDDKWTDFLHSFYAAKITGVRRNFSFQGVAFSVEETGGDGFFEPGIAVDAGMIAEFDLTEAKNHLGLVLFEFSPAG